MHTHNKIDTNIFGLIVPKKTPKGIPVQHMRVYFRYYEMVKYEYNNLDA